ncbi:unnamed protein product [Durusdinium trenchii]|uniref:MsrB domain-containing protein n=1 Tax=Durusdinium trenchii TaxID=1381693 RepID=A0ABP0Q3R2_9DINO
MDRTFLGLKAFPYPPRFVMAEPSRDPAAYEAPSSKGSSFLGSANVDVRSEKSFDSKQKIRGVIHRLPEDQWMAKLRANVYKVLRKKATEPGHRIKFPEGFDDHKEEGVYLCAGCHAAGQQVPLYTSKMKFECGCGWPGFWTNVKDAVYEQRDADGRRCEILCSKCNGHLGHVFRGEGFPFCTDERHCVNSLSLVFLPHKGGDVVSPSYSGPVFG